jgi:hypothetical protein
MSDKRLSFGYEDTDKSIEVELYGIVFEINNVDDIGKLKEIDSNNGNAVEEIIEKLLGKGSIERINNKRRKDGYKELDLNIELNILGCIFEAYARETTEGIMNKVTDVVEDINGNVGNLNRYQRRNYYKNNRRNYRRY